MGINALGVVVGAYLIPAINDRATNLEQPGTKYITIEIESFRSLCVHARVGKMIIKNTRAFTPF
jgi:hypothetical protein